MPFFAPRDENYAANQIRANLLRITAPPELHRTRKMIVQDEAAEVINAISEHSLRHPGSHAIPDHLERRLRDVFIREEVVQFGIRDKSHGAQVALIKAQIARDMIPAAARHRFHRSLADMIKLQVQPLNLDHRMPDVVKRLENCHETGQVGIDPSGELHYHWPEKCRFSKFCPWEARLESQRLAERYIPPLLETLATTPGSKLQKIVISPRNIPAGELAGWMRKIFKIYVDLSRRKEFRISRKDSPGPILGSIVVQEAPLGRDPDTWNVHINVIQIVVGRFPWARYRAAWAAALGQDDCQMDFKVEHQMRAITKKRLEKRGINTPVGRLEILTYAFLEMVKYSAKIAGSDHGDESSRAGGALAKDKPDVGCDAKEPVFSEKRVTLAEALPMDRWPPLRWLEWYRANCGFRRTRSYGCLYNVPEPEPEEQPVINYMAEVSWDVLKESYVIFVSLIPADNFTFRGPEKVDNWHETGPPWGSTGVG